jgi:HipA-like protein
LLKFDVGADGVLGSSAGFGRVEYAHYLMTTDAGVRMNECCLLEEGGRAHFMTQRFDRHGARAGPAAMRLQRGRGRLRRSHQEFRLHDG